MIEQESDDDMRQLAEEELAELEQRQQSYLEDIRDGLVGNTDTAANDASGAILEIRPGIGGEESALFVYEMARMYQRWCVSPEASGEEGSQPWDVALLSATPTLDPYLPAVGFSTCNTILRWTRMCATTSQATDNAYENLPKKYKPCPRVGPSDHQLFLETQVLRAFHLMDMPSLRAVPDCKTRFLQIAFCLNPVIHRARPPSCSIPRNYRFCSASCTFRTYD